MHRLAHLALMRLDSIDQQLNHILQSAFPYDSSRKFLLALQQELQSYRNFVNKPQLIDSKVHSALQARTILDQIFHFIELIGIAQRSSSQRLAFELYAPLSDLTRGIVEKNLPSSTVPDIVISSEWDYSPLYFPSKGFFSNFALLGLPACESDNPMLLPLMGHEIGHSIWQIVVSQAGSEHELGKLWHLIMDCLIKQCDECWDELTAVLSIPKTDHALLKDWLEKSPDQLKKYLKPLLALHDRHANETFADFMGIRVFGRSYFYAFSYLAAPMDGDEPNKDYPSPSTRIQHMLAYAKSQSITWPASFIDDFSAKEDASSLVFPVKDLSGFDAKSVREREGAIQFLTILSERAIIDAGSHIASLASCTCDTAKLPIPSEESGRDLYRSLVHSMPAICPGRLGDLMCAAWRLFDELNINHSANSNANPTSKEEFRVNIRTLKEAVLKSLEASTLEVVR